MFTVGYIFIGGSTKTNVDIFLFAHYSHENTLDDISFETILTISSFTMTLIKIEMLVLLIPDMISPKNVTNILHALC